ncbi:MAG TPA: Ig-like domain-containing protein [Candidatus Saccharimonadia bacterium]|nr:Ig-like domain-containing protein [Candidatus Saccharimonadia bacterium]
MRISLQAKLRGALIAAACSIAFSGAAIAASPDHHEFEAMLEAPYQGAAGDAREFVLRFAFPDAQDPNTVAWRLELLSPAGERLRTWHGEERLYGAAIEVAVPWDGRGRARELLVDGHYTARLSAIAGDPVAFRTHPGSLAQRVDAVLADPHAQVQSWDVEVGKPRRPEMPFFEPLPTGRGVQQKSAPATASLPYTVYFGNLHSQTNDSDGGGAIPGCSGSQGAQTGAFGPNDAFVYADGHGLDFLLSSEHNHYFDGSSSTNTSASPTTAKNRYAAGRTAASNYNAANPGFLALYGMEWGVISGGGHLNIIDGHLLAGWEYNSSNQLLADIFTTKSDYANLYVVMKQQGWIGQFNHPSTSDQFPVGGTVFGYHADGDEVMVAAEIQNTSAFSDNTTETETSRSTYESAFNLFLERGYHVGPATNQDNHCANWGASWTNRTGVLLPTGQVLDAANFEAALRARRFFATSDKNSQLILTANGRVMGERFTNSGALTLTANYANTAGRVASQVAIYEGVPKRNGTVTLLSSAAVTTITPGNGEHFYYAKVTQDDGKILWSAPIWVTQTTSADTTPPSVSASESGTSGTITLSATASDNAGVTQVEFYVDSVLKGTDTTSPYSMTLDSTTLANGSHTLTAKAFDAAGNTTTSSPVTFSISNATADTTPPTVTASESGTSGTITLSATASDDVGVTQVEFYVDSVLKGTDTTSPYSMTLDSNTLSNGSHTLTAKAFDAAGNTTTSSPVTFTIDNAAAAVERIVNGTFESGKTGWTATSGVITKNSSVAAHGGVWKAWLNGYGSANTETAYQSVAIPSTATQATLSFWLDVITSETTTTTAWDNLTIEIRNSSNTVLATLGSYSNLNGPGGYTQKSFDVLAWKGQTVRVYFKGVEGSSVATSFIVDDVSLTTR